MVAAARMRRAQSAILSSRPFAVKLEETIHELALLERASGGESAPVHPFFAAPADDPRPGLLLVTADRGLCGSFNAMLLRAAAHWLMRARGRKVSVAVVGRKGRDFLRRLQGEEIERLVDVVGIFPKVGFKHSDLVGEPLMQAFRGGKISSVTAIYNEFRSVISQRVVERELLPIPISSEPARAMDFRFEPERRRVLAALLPRYLKAQLYRILLESQAAELAARMNAMDAAARNAGELIDSLTLTLNRTRQGLITREIAELVGGAEALAS
jgi:F-type H+-transporting ATPase subunit gamma